MVYKRQETGYRRTGNRLDTETESRKTGQEDRTRRVESARRQDLDR